MSGYNIPSGSTVSLVQGTKAITIAGASWYLLGIAASGTLRVNGRNVTVASVPSSGAPQLLFDWSDDDVEAAPYEVFPDFEAHTFSADSKAFQARANQMLSIGRLVDTGGNPLSPDCYVGLALKGNGTNTPPTTPFLNDAYYVGTAPTGAWAAAANKVAVWAVGGWRFFAPFDGLAAYDVTTVAPLIFSQGAWLPLSAVSRIFDHAANYPFTASDASLSIHRFNASAGDLSATIARSLGATTGAKLFIVQRHPDDTSSNFIHFVDDAGARIGVITSPCVGSQVPFLIIYADATRVTAWGSP